MKTVGVIAAATALLLVGHLGYRRPVQTRGRNGSVGVRACNDSRVRTFLSGWSQGGGGFPGGIEFACREVGVGSSAEELVYLNGRDSCGSGGCQLLVLVPSPDLGYVVVGNIRTVWAPIRVLDSKTHGLYDLVGFVAGGGVLPGYNAKLTYDGKSYPPGGSSGTEIPPGSPLGTVVISRAMAAHPEVM